MVMGLKQLIADYLKEALVMQVATAKESQPWACTVHFASDKDFYLFWISKSETRHSEEIEQNEKVAGTIVLPQKKGEKPRGIQFQGIAKRLNDKQEREKAISTLAEKTGMTEEKKQNLITGGDNRAVYQIKPAYFIFFDTVNFPDNPRQKYVL